MFDNCNNMAELNQARIEAIKNGNPAILVNREYAHRKALLMSGEDKGFKRVSFVPSPIPELELQVGVDFAYEENFTIYVHTGK